MQRFRIPAVLVALAVATGCGSSGSTASSTKSITAFGFLAANNSVLTADVVASINGTSIAATVPSGTNVTALVASFTTTGSSVSVGSTTQTSGTTANNFTNPVSYVVTAADGSTQTYTVTVATAPNSAKAITGFAFLAANNSGLANNVTATINGTAIAATVPFGTNVTALVASFTTTGASVSVGSAAQTSGVTANNFTSPVNYVVTAADSSTQTYTVTVTVAASSAKAITLFEFLTTNNSGLAANVTATINGTSITATVPNGTAVTALVATFTTTGSSVAVGGKAQVNGQTANDFTNPVSYVVTAGDGSTQTYTVTVTVAASSAKAITAFSFLTANNSGLASNVTATINGTSIAATVPSGTSVSALVVTFTTTGASVSVGSTTQASGVTPNNFTNPVSYVVTAGDGSTQTYTVTVTVAASSQKAITLFEFLTTNNSGLASNVTGSINGTAITATVPYGTGVTALVATFTTTGASVSVGTTTQTSGQTPNNFTSPVNYVVTAADSSTQTYTVTVIVAPNPAKAITLFEFLTTNNSGLSANVTATINTSTFAIAATVPFGTNVTALVATYATTGISVAVGTTAQTSGVTSNNFTNPVTYTVTAADGTTQNYTVTVTVALSPAKAITAFEFVASQNPGFPNGASNVTATINTSTFAIAATVPFGTTVTALVATFTTTGASVSVASTKQTSGQTANNFTSPVVYTVTAADGTTQNYTVTVTIYSPIGDVAVNVGTYPLGAFVYKLKAADGSISWGPITNYNCGGLAVDPLDYGVYVGNDPTNCNSSVDGVFKYDLNGNKVWNNQTSITSCGGCGGRYTGSGGIAVDTWSTTPGVVYTASAATILAPGTTSTEYCGTYAKVSRVDGSEIYCFASDDLGRPSIANSAPAAILSGETYMLTNGPLHAADTIYAATATTVDAHLSSVCQGLTEVNPTDNSVLFFGGNMATNGCGLLLYSVQTPPATQPNDENITVDFGTVSQIYNFSGAVSSFDSLAVQPWSGGYLYVGSSVDKKIVVLNPYTVPLATVVTTFSVAATPDFIAVNPIGGDVYVASKNSQYVYAYSPTGTLIWTSPALGSTATNIAAVRGVVGQE